MPLAHYQREPANSSRNDTQKQVNFVFFAQIFNNSYNFTLLEILSFEILDFEVQPIDSFTVFAICQLPPHTQYQIQCKEYIFFDWQLIRMIRIISGSRFAGCWKNDIRRTRYQIWNCNERT